MQIPKDSPSSPPPLPNLQTNGPPPLPSLPTSVPPPLPTTNYQSIDMPIYTANSAGKKTMMVNPREDLDKEQLKTARQKLASYNLLDILEKMLWASIFIAVIAIIFPKSIYITMIPLSIVGAWVAYCGSRFYQKIPGNILIKIYTKNGMLAYLIMILGYVPLIATASIIGIINYVDENSWLEARFGILLISIIFILFSKFVYEKIKSFIEIVE